MTVRDPLLLALLLMSSTALADRRALSLDISAGWLIETVAAQNVDPKHVTLVNSPAFQLGVRYALTHNIEFTASAFSSVPATIYANDVTLVTDAGRFPGTLQSQSIRFGGFAGVRGVFGMVWRFVVGADVGYSHRINYSLVMYDDSDPSEAIDYGLTIRDQSIGQLVLSPYLGIEWCAGDHWSLSFLPRAQLLLFNQFTWSVTFPLQFSWSWYL